MADPWAFPDRTRPVLAAIYRRYDHLLREPADARFFEIECPSDLWSWFPQGNRGRWLGYSLPPRHKLDGARPQGAPAVGEPGDAPGFWEADGGDAALSWRGRALDGVWDFRAEFGLLYVCSPGHAALEGDLAAIHHFEAVLGGREADVAGLERWLGSESRRLAAEGRRVIGLGGTDDIVGLRTDLAAVILPDGVLSGLVRDLELFCGEREWYAEHQVPWRRGLLLYGPPGNGKTTVARCLASRALDLGGAAFAFTPAGHRDGDVRSAFRRASAAAPAVLLMEDVDALRESRITRAVFLSLVEDPVHTHGVFLVATTNYPEEVDPALAGRAGRFDRAVHLPAPDAVLRRRLLERLWHRGPLQPLVVTAVEQTAGLSIASLNEVHYSASMWLRDGRIVDEAAVAAIAADLRRAEMAKTTHDWGGGRVGFRAEA